MNNSSASSTGNAESTVSNESGNSSRRLNPMNGLTRRRVEEKIQEFIKRLFDARNEVNHSFIHSFSINFHHHPTTRVFCCTL